MKYLISISLLAMIQACSRPPTYQEMEYEASKGLSSHEYEIRKDTVAITSDTLFYTMTVLQDGYEVHEEYLYSVLCPKWIVPGKEYYQNEDIYSILQQ